MGCKSPHARAARPAASLEPEPAPAPVPVLVLVPVPVPLSLDLGNWQLVFGWFLGCSLGLFVGLVLGPSCGLGPRLVGLVLFRPPPFPRQRAKRDATSSV